MIKQSEIKLKELVEASAEELKSKFENFGLTLDSVPALIKILITFHVQKSNYEKNYFSIERYLECLRSVSKSLEYHEKALSSQQLELRGNKETSSYVYFDTELKTISDMKPLVPNLRNQTVSEQNSTVTPQKPVYSPPPPLPKESEPVKSPPPPPPPPLPIVPEEIDMMPTIQHDINSTDDTVDTTALTSQHEQQHRLEDKVSNTSKPDSNNSADDSVSEKDPLCELPPEIEKLREDINDPKRQYKVYKKLKKFARQQAKANGGSRHELLTRLWSKLNQSTRTDSPAASLASSRSQSPEVLNTSVEVPDMDEPSSHQRYFLPEISHSVIENETNQGSVFGPQHQKQQNADVLKGSATSECTEIGSNQASVFGPQYQEPENYTDMRADQFSNLPPPPPPLTSKELDHDVSKSPSPEAEPGVVYCLPAHVPQIALDDLPDASKDVKKDSKSTVQVSAALVTKKMKASSSNSNSTHKFKNKNMSKLVDKWTKVKKEIDEDPQAIEGDYYFEPQSIEKMRQSQMRYDQSNPNLIQIDDTKNKIKTSKSSRR